MPTQWAGTAQSRHGSLAAMRSPTSPLFRRQGITRPLFKLPHVFRPPAAQLQSPDESRQLARVRPDDFVIYGIFEWQERKMPMGQLTAYMRAFPRDGEHVLVLQSERERCSARRPTKRSAMPDARPVPQPAWKSSPKSGVTMKSTPCTNAAIVISPSIAAKAGAIRSSTRCAVATPLWRQVTPARSNT